MEDNNQQISTLLSDLNEKQIIAAVKDRLARGDDPVLIMDQCQEGIVDVGKRFNSGEYFISALIMAGEIMSQISDILLPVLKAQITCNASGRILLATVQKDIHFIGKNIFKVLLQCTGYNVQDAGEDVAPEIILEEALSFSPKIIGLSCLLNSCYDSMRDTVSILKEGTRNMEIVPRIIIGGRVNEKVARYVEADGWADDAMIGLRLCNKLIREIL
jgi:methanogenic corrinoid protein MtbC1